MVTVRWLNPDVDCSNGADTPRITRRYGRLLSENAADRRDNRVMADDDEMARLRAVGWSFRQIARELGMSLAGVQRALKRAGGVVGQPAAQIIDQQDRMIHEYLSKLYDKNGALSDLYLYRLAHVMAPSEFAKLCARLGRAGSFGQDRIREGGFRQGQAPR